MINKNNYEEYFLLYADNELDAAERLAVEEFISLHPKYAEELSLLQQTILPYEKIAFEAREDLFKTVGNNIDITNYQEHFLLYTDNELSEEKKADTERFILQHPQLQQEFIQLQSSRLSTDIIEFANKESLYRKQQEERRIVPLYVKRLAVAAAVIGTSLLVWWLSPVPAKHSTDVVKTNHTGKPVIITPRQQMPVHMPAIKPKNNDEVAVQTHFTVQKHNSTAAINEAKETTKPQKEKAGIATKIFVEKPAIIQLPVPPPANNNSTALVTVTIATERKTTTALKPLEEVQSNDITGDKTVYASGNTNAAKALKEIDTDEDDDNPTLYVASLQLNKNKVNGLFKKAGRLLGNKAKQEANEDGKLQVAGFEVNTRDLK